MSDLRSFVAESNAIEGIDHVADDEIEAHARLLLLERLTVADIEAFVSVIAPGTPLRSKIGMDVRVGRYIAPPGGPDIVIGLQHLLAHANARDWTPHRLHVAYELLHPFMDGNGRSGRAIWLWMRNGNAPLRFLHHFYYETLAEAQQ